MNRLDIGDLRRRYDLGDVEIRMKTGCRTDTNFLIGEIQVTGISVRFRVDRDRLDIEFATSTDHTESNLSAVGNQYSRKWLHSVNSILKKNRTGVGRIQQDCRHR